LVLQLISPSSFPVRFVLKAYPERLFCVYIIIIYLKNNQLYIVLYNYI
jgi:hypothetical protein